MGRQLTIEPVTRIEGHARVTIQLGDDGRVADARVQVTQLRGFEALCVGRLLGELPALTSRVCGICPVAHEIASAKAGDAVLGAAPPPAARLLRRVLLLAQLVQSHALSFFLLTGPDVLPEGVDPARRSLFGLAEEEPELARDGVALRRFGQAVIEQVAGRRVHPAFAVPGGVARPLDPAVRDGVLAAIPEAIGRARRALDGWWRRLPALAGDGAAGGEIETLFLALVGAGGELEHADGRIRVVSARGEVVADGLDPARYHELLGEEVEPWTYAKVACWRALGRPAGVYRVGPLARLDVVSRCGTPLADAELARFRTLAPGPNLSTFHAHLARLVEIVFALERMEELLADPAVLGRDVLASPGRARGEGVGAIEAPRGTLFHRYRVDADGVVTFVDLVVPTGQNALAMNLAVRRVAERWLTGERLDEALVRRVEAAVRAFDPCLSCAAHPAGARWVAVRLVGARGELLAEAPGAER
jgi:NAD-reducing hydrogenase large subunit